MARPPSSYNAPTPLEKIFMAIDTNNPKYIQEIFKVFSYEKYKKELYEKGFQSDYYTATQDRFVCGEKTTFMHIAAKHGGYEAMSYFQKKGENINAKNSAGITPAMYLAANGTLSDLKKLLKNQKINLNEVSDDGRNILHFAASSGDKAKIQYLHRAGVNIKAKDGNGSSLAHYIVNEWENRLACIPNETHEFIATLRYLKDMGVNLNTENYYGNTPLDNIAKIEIQNGKKVRKNCKLYSDKPGLEIDLSLIQFLQKEMGEKNVQIEVEEEDYRHYQPCGSLNKTLKNSTDINEQSGLNQSLAEISSNNTDKDLTNPDLSTYKNSGRV